LGTDKSRGKALLSPKKVVTWAEATEALARKNAARHTNEAVRFTR